MINQNCMCSACMPDVEEPTRPEPVGDTNRAATPVRGGPHDLLKQALDALESGRYERQLRAAICIREYLDNTKEQEPAADVLADGMLAHMRKFVPVGTKLYLHPAPTLPGEVVVTTDASGRCVCVTRQNEESQILSVIWEAKPIPPGMVLVPEEPTIVMLRAGVAARQESSLTVAPIWEAMLAAAKGEK